MSIDAHDICSKAIRSLRFNWIQNPETMLDERLQTVGLRSEYLKNDPKLFEIFRKKLYRKLNKRYRGLLNFIVPARFICQTKIMWYMLKRKPKNEQTYEPIRAITIPPFRKRLIPRKTVEKPVIKSRSKQLKDINPTSNLPKGLRKRKQDTQSAGSVTKDKVYVEKNPIVPFFS